MHRSSAVSGTAEMRFGRWLGHPKPVSGLYRLAVEFSGVFDEHPSYYMDGPPSLGMSDLGWKLMGSLG